MRLLSRVTLMALGLASGLCIAEMLFRLAGDGPGSTPSAYSPADFGFRDPYTANPAAGWQLKQGNYVLTLAGRDRPSRISINADASRATRASGAPLPEVAPKILLIGDSYIFGDGLDDEESLPWRLQELLPDRNVINHGVGGYGTCQALLRLQQLESALGPGDIVLYGLSAFHEERNTADPRLDYWAAMSSPSHASGYRRCRVVENALVREAPRVWQVIMPLTGRLVLSRILTDAWLNVLFARSRRENQSVTDFLLRAMNSTAAAHGASFIVLLQELPADALSHYRAVLESSGIAYIDGTEIAGKPDLKLPDGHPGPGMTALWVKQLAEYITTHHGTRSSPGS